MYAGLFAAMMSTALLPGTHPSPLLVGAGGALVILVADLVRLPSTAQRHRNAGRLDRAAQHLAVWAHIAPTKSSRTKARLALASVLLSSGRFEEGGAILRLVDRASLPAGLGATWDLDHAYYLIGTHHDPQKAFSIVDQLETSADPACPPAFTPTRGLALLAMGRTLDAVTALTNDIATKKLGAAELAEANYHLAQAWKTLGHPAYAADHLVQACNLCAASPYAAKATREIESDRTTEAPMPARRSS